MESTKTTIAPAASDTVCQNPAILTMLNRLLSPLVRICLAHGVTFAAVEEVLKGAFVREAHALQPDAPTHGAVSRISTATGINRREVTRLVRSEAPPRSTKPLISTEVFARWIADPQYRDENNSPLTLKRQGPSPSFEALAQSITRDRHPRSILEDLLRLGIIDYDEEHDRVALARSEFVPTGDLQEMFDLLNDNVGDHLNAAVANVLQDGCSHLEQAVFADELSVESVEALRPLISGHWRNIRTALVPAITALIEEDRIAGRPQDQRVRIGLYSFQESTAGEAEPPSATRNHYTKESHP